MAPFRKHQRLLFIVGNQRSGTTMLLDLFERDFRSRTFSEYGLNVENMHRSNRSIRMKPLNEVRSILGALREPILVSKPLVESQRTRQILDYFPESRALWAYRHYHDAVSSNVKLFHSQVESCRIIVDKEPANWRSERVPEAAYNLVRKYYDTKMSPEDAAALMWYARNSLFFDQNLQSMPSVRLWKYEDFVQNPAGNLARIYAWLNMRPPGPHVTKFVSPRSVGLGHNVTLSEEIETSCSELLSQLNNYYCQMVD